MLLHLGVITCPATSSRSNASTAAPFVIASTTRRLLLLARTGADLSVEVTRTDGAFTTDASKGLPLAAGVAREVPIAPGGAAIKVAAYNAGGGAEAVDVWAMA